LARAVSVILAAMHHDKIIVPADGEAVIRHMDD